MTKSKVRSTPRTPEQLAKEKERIRKLQRTRLDPEFYPYYRPDGTPLSEHDALLEALKKEHPEKDPDKIIS